MSALVPELFDDGERRVRDLDLAERLGFDRPSNIRNLIERNFVELERYGVCFTAKQTSGREGGRPGSAYWLNEPQAVLICIKSDTLRSEDVRQEVIEVFMAYRTGHLAPATPSVEQILVGQLEPVKQGIDRIEGNVIHLTNLAARTDERLSAIEGKITNWREGFSKDTVQFAGSAIATYNDCLCIFCYEVTVVDSRGQKLTTGRVHHGNGNRVDLRAQNCTIPCEDCHARLHKPNRPDHIPAHEPLAIVSSFYRKVRLKAGQIKPPNVTALPYQKPMQRQLPMPLPRIVPKNSRDKPE
jgi:hypothetical protein